MNNMAGNPFAAKTATLTNDDVDRDEAAIGIDESEFTMAGLDAEEQLSAQVLAEESTGSERPRTKRRIVRKVDLKQVAQEMLMDGVANVLGYWHENEANQKKLAELGVTQEQLGDALLKQADRVAKSLGFEQAWSN